MTQKRAQPTRPEEMLELMRLAEARLPEHMTSADIPRLMAYFDLPPQIKAEAERRLAAARRQDYRSPRDTPESIRAIRNFFC